MARLMSIGGGQSEAEHEGERNKGGGKLGGVHE